MNSDSRATLQALIEKWRSRDRTLNANADASPSQIFARSLADRAECYGRCADELTNLLVGEPDETPQGAKEPQCGACGACGAKESSDGDWYTVCGSCRWEAHDPIPDISTTDLEYAANLIENRIPAEGDAFKLLLVARVNRIRNLNIWITKYGPSGVREGESTPFAALKGALRGEESDEAFDNAVAGVREGVGASPQQRCNVKWANFNLCVRPMGHEEPHLTDAGFSWRVPALAEEA